MISRDIECCPYCGSEEYYIKQSYKGSCEFRMRFDGEEADNSDMFDGAIYKDTSKYAWCSKCDKRLFKFDSDDQDIVGEAIKIANDLYKDEE